MDPHERARRIASWAGHSLDSRQLSQLDAYADWLLREAQPAGGIGPDEAPRIWDRHICDSLSFACGWPGLPPKNIIDVGSGVGLPGIPLSILWQSTHIALLDRSGRRIELLRRLVRVMELSNVNPVLGEISGVRGDFDGIVARGVMNPARLAAAVSHLAGGGGRTVVGLTRKPEAQEALSELGTVVLVPPEVLDGGGQILIIDPRDR